MYKCRYCGSVSYGENAGYCRNVKCDYYCNRRSADTAIERDNAGRYISDEHQLGFATVPFQTFGEIYPPDKGLRSGTIFPELAMPYTKKIFRRGY